MSGRGGTPPPRQPFEATPMPSRKLSTYRAKRDFSKTAEPSGDLPGIGMTVIDGVVRTERSRNTPPAMRVPKIIK